MEPVLAHRALKHILFLGLFAILAVAHAILVLEVVIILVLIVCYRFLSGFGIENAWCGVWDESVRLVSLIAS